MPNRSWSYEPTVVKRRRDRQEFEGQARRFLVRKQADTIAVRYGGDPTTYAPSNTLLDRSEEADLLREDDDGGIFGTLSKFIGKGASVGMDIARTPSKLSRKIVRPIDKLTGTKIASTVVGEITDPLALVPIIGPATRAFKIQYGVAKEALNIAFEGLEWEAETLGSPTVRAVGTGIAAPFRMAIHGESFDEALKAGWKRTAKESEGGVISDWFHDLASSMYAPTSLATLGLPLAKIPKWAKIGLSGARATGRAEVARPMAAAFGTDFMPLMGASDQVSLMAAPRGNRLNQEAVIQMHDSLRDATSFGEAGPASLVKGNWLGRLLRREAAVGNPSINLDRNVHVGQNVRLGVKSGEEAIASSRTELALDEVIRLWDLERPTWIGPAGHASQKLRQGKALALLTNPELYSGISPRLRSRLYELGVVGDSNTMHFRTTRNVDVNLFRPDNYDQGAIYVPTIAATDNAAIAASDIASNLYKLAQMGTRPGVTRPRFYQNVWEHMAANPDFVPETNLYRLFSIHDSGLARAAGAEGFNTAVGGKTLIVVKDEISPGTKVAKESVAASLQSVKGRAATLVSKIKGLGAKSEVYETELVRLRNKADPVVDALSELSIGEEYGPEFSYLAGQWHELKISLAATRKAAGKNLDKSVTAKGELGALEKEVETLSGQLTALVKTYRGIEIDKAKYVKSEFTRLYHSPKVAGDIARVLDEGRPGLFGDVMDEIRLFVFAADFSPLTIQGFLGAFADPINLMRSSGAILKAAGKNLFRKGGYNPWNDIIAENPDKIMRYAMAKGRAPGARGMRQTGEIAKEIQGLERLPGVVGGALRAGNNRMMNMVAVLELNGWWNDTRMVQRWGGVDEAGEFLRTAWVADKETIKVWSNIIPDMSAGERGISVVRARRERLPFISTSFIASPAIFLKDVTSAMLHLGLSTKLSPGARFQALSGREQLSLLRFTNMVGTMMTAATTSALLSAKSRGWSPEEAVMKVFDPNSPQFMSIILADKGQIGLGGPLRSLIKNTFGSSDNKGNWVPLAGIMPGVSLAQGDVLPRFWKGKLAPSVGFFVDMLQNEDYRGREIYGDKYPINILETLWYATEAHSPISLGTASEMVRTGQEVTPSTLAVNVGAQITGQNYKEVSNYDKIRMARDDVAHQHYNKNWEDLESGQRTFLTDKYPERLTFDPTSDIGLQYASRDEMLANYQASQVQLDDALPAGPAWIEAHRRLNIMKSAAIEEWERDNTEASEEQRREPRNEGEEALGQYFEAFNTSKTAWGDLDLELLSMRLNQLEAQWTPSQKAYIERNTGVRDTPLEKEYKNAQKVLKPYWKIADDVWSRLQSRFPDKYAKFGDIDEWLKSQTDMLMRRGMNEEDAFKRASSNLTVRHYQDAVSKLRLKLRISSPSVQAELFKWYGMQSPRKQASAFRYRPSFLRPVGAV